MPLPDRIQNAPEILPGLQLFFIGFLDLSSSRQIGMGLGAVPWKTIFDYCEAFGLDEEQTEAMHHHIRVMDTAYINFKKKG